RGDFGAVKSFDIFDEQTIISNIDVTNQADLRRAIQTVRPAVVINAVGVIKQNPRYNDVVQTLLINSIFPHQLAELSAEFGFRLISISTDCVFDGTKGNYSEDDTPTPRDLYGMSKLLGEVIGDNFLTIRTSIIGRELSTKNSIVEWFLSHSGGTVKGYTHAIYTGFVSDVFADIIAKLISDHPDLSGIYHISSEPISKFSLLQLLNEFYDAGVKIVPSSDVVIDRSLDSSKFKSETGFEPLSWPEMIKRVSESNEPPDQSQSWPFRAS
ncbi:MAG: SDR family oxidoreductase, partial [Pyrinomonadaceae bacterium]